MSITINQGQTKLYSLSPGSLVNIIPAGTAPMIENMGGGSDVVSRDTVTSASQIGPYVIHARVRVSCLSGSVTIGDVSQYFGDLTTNSLGVVNAQKALAKKNQLVKVWPTRVAVPYGKSGDVGYSSKEEGGGGTISIDYAKADPMTGLPMAKCHIPSGSTSYLKIHYESTFDPFHMENDDSWFLTCYLPDRVDYLGIQLVISSSSVEGGSNRREMTFNKSSMQRGWNILQCLHVERSIGASEYGVVGTSWHAGWNNFGTQTDAGNTASVSANCRFSVAAEADIDIHLGSIHRAPFGWARAGMCWMGDDGALSFHDKAVPIFEEYGWNYTLAAVPGNMGGDASGTSLYMSVDDVRRDRDKGHEIWNHTRLHDNMDTSTTEEKQSSIDASVAFFGCSGFVEASRFLAWPFGAYDDESIAMCKAAGILLARSINGDSICPAAAGINPYYLNAFSVERANSWQTDSMIEGNILRGTGMITYGHQPVDGGAGLDVYPAATRFYVDHLRRWCDRVAEHEAAGRVVVTTPLEYFRLCGIDPYTHNFQE